MLSQHSDELKVVDKLPPPIPLLKSSFLQSQRFKSFIHLDHQPITNIQQITKPNHLAAPSKLFSIQYPFRKISDILIKQQKILFNLFDGTQSSRQETFGAEYYGEHIQSNKQKLNYGNHSHSPIKFQSRFECGNLSLVYQINKNDYLLVIRPDYNTTSFCQWFYFQIRNTSNQQVKIKLSIINMTKSSSLFSQGMKIMTLSSLDQKWERGGENICYSKNNLKRFNDGSNYYTLSWNVTIKQNESLLMAYSQPYSYTRLNHDLDIFEQNKYVKRTVLSRSILDNRIDTLTISEGKQNRKKSLVIITARCHPVETVSSYVMKGVIQFLISQAPQAVLLRQNFVFKLIPMVNPDGVIHGNSRCTLAGFDPNRRWSKPTKQIFDLKKFILKQKDRLVMYIDLHGHSKKKNVFTYGCNDRNKPLASRELPYIFSKLFDAFSFKDCNFRVNKYKQGTARITLWKTLKLPNIFTLQSSFCSSQKSNLHLDEEGYKITGSMLCKAINICLSNHILNKNSSQIHQNMKQQILNQIQNEKQLLKIGMDESDSSQSEQQHIIPFSSTSIQDQPKIYTPLINPRMKSNKSAQINSRYKQQFRNIQSNSLLGDLRNKNKIYRRVSEISLSKKIITARSLVEDQKTLQHGKQQTQKDEYKLNFKIKSHSKNIMRIKNPIKSLTPRSFLSGKIVNFEFGGKLQREQQMNKEDYFKKKTQHQNSNQRKNEYQALLSTFQKSNFKNFAQNKLKINKQQSKRTTVYRRSNVLNRLQLFMKKVVDK